MNKLENIKSKNIDELAEWFDKYMTFDDAPWLIWWDKHYCHRCRPETRKEYVDCLDREIDVDYAWCELNNGKCKFFENMDKIPDNKEIIKLWLLSEENEDDEYEYGTLA